MSAPHDTNPDPTPAGAPDRGPDPPPGHAAAAGTHVEVLVPAPLLRALTYRVPLHLGEHLVPGVRVRVPLGSRRVIGVISAVGASPPPGVEIKDVLEPLDEVQHPALGPDLLETLRYAVEYYVAAPGDVLRAALPAALLPARPSSKAGPVDETPRGAPRRRRVVSVSAAAAAEPAAVRAQLARATAQLRVFETSLVRGALLAPDLARAAEATSAAIAALLSSGILVAAWVDEAPEPPPEVDFPVTPPPQLSPDQRAAVDHLTVVLDQRRFQPVVLFGVTGAGKTEVYLRAAQHVLTAGRTALFLVPEIGLTPHLRQSLAARFGDAVVVLHSGLTDRQRYEAWERARLGAARIVVGARSAVFAPLKDLALIVVDEEHDGGYKQEDSPRYHARDLALVRGRAAGAVVVLGSATPSLEAWVLTLHHRADLLRLPARVSGGVMADVHVVDMREEFRETKHDQPLSRRLRAELQAALTRGEQSIVLLNRRGYTAEVMCRACGEAIQCPACSIPLTWHRVGERLRCHYCGHAARRPDTCPTCDSPHLKDLGHGTQRIEESVAAAVPEARVVRLDRDTVRSARRLTDILGGFARGEADVLVGTQMVAKGHHFPRVTVVGVVSADAALRMPDFRAAERTFQLLTQVAGRAGRSDRPGRVIVQAYLPEHPAVQAATRQDFEAFAERELALRTALRYPPSAALAVVLVRDLDRDRAFERAADLVERIRAAGQGHVAILGPTLAPLARLKHLWRVQIMVRAQKRRRVSDAIGRAILTLVGEQGVLPPWLVVDVDPQQLM